MPILRLLPVCLILLLTACHPREDAAAQAAVQAAAREQAAAAMEKQFNDAVAAQNWRLAKGYADVLQSDYPASAAAQRIRPQLADIRAKAEAQVQQQRLEALWSYDDIAVPGGHQRSAAIYSQEPVDTDGSGAHPVRLIFRDHPTWGRSTYLVLQAGDFDCYRGCRLKVTVDGKVHTLPGSRPKTDEAIAMFIDDWKGLWKLAKSGKQLTIEFPTRDVGTRTARFEGGG